MPHTRERFLPLLEDRCGKVSTAEGSATLSTDADMVFGAFQRLRSRGVVIRNDPRRGSSADAGLASLYQAAQTIPFSL